MTSSVSPAVSGAISVQSVHGSSTTQDPAGRTSEPSLGPEVASSSRSNGSPCRTSRSTNEPIKDEYCLLDDNLHNVDPDPNLSILISHERYLEFQYTQSDNASAALNAPENVISVLKNGFLIPFFVYS